MDLREVYAIVIYDI